ncbi:NAD(P)/FAD-dependent oxidoreductase [Brevundimonas sp. 2R-24]|uniref:NAD(P)/FAD-dependent oxidoreductase n=1 Tax=Peiella sedimenti TaxID=3061083 RepID=A0ABT8SPS9_9CAUL|nr:NAD(P)/FAD-dependent oxidoreductase [Caulobacteraceae bacterium XZ-24]
MILKDVAVVGAGPSGLALALMLARQGRRVVVHERFDRPRPVGAGFMLQPTGLHVLDTLELGAEAEAVGAPIQRLFGREARRRRIVLDVGYAALNRPRTAVGIHRTAMFDLLFKACVAEGVVFETRREITGASEGRLTDSRGWTSAGFDLVVDASGARSAIAAALRPRRTELAYGALWTTVPQPGAPFDPAALEQVYRGAARMIGVLPCGRGPDGERCATFFWSLKPAQYGAWREVGLEAWKAEVLSLWPETAPVLAAIEDADQLTLARYGHHTLGRPCANRVAVIGDAAHATSPQLGQGVNMGLLDAWVLARALESSADLEAALFAYCRERRWHVRLYQALSLIFTPFYQADGALLPWVRDHVLGKVARLPMADRLLAATVSGLLLDPRRADRTFTAS